MARRMPVTTCTVNANSSRLPNAAAQRAPPGSGSSSITSLNRFQPVRCSQKPVEGGLVSVVTRFSLNPIVSHANRRLLGDANLEILPADAQPAVAHFCLQRVHPPWRRTGRHPAFSIEGSLVTGAHEFRALRPP